MLFLWYNYHMNHDNIYHTWITEQKNENKTWQEIILSAIEKFSDQVPDQKPKQSTEIFLLFSYLSHELDTPAEIHSLLIDIMLYCEGEYTGGYADNNYHKNYLLTSLVERIKNHT